MSSIVNKTQQGKLLKLLCRIWGLCENVGCLLVEDELKMQTLPAFEALANSQADASCSNPAVTICIEIMVHRTGGLH
jgi:hypothetical protein